jgi:hypothetical protein
MDPSTNKPAVNPNIPVAQASTENRAQPIGRLAEAPNQSKPETAHAVETAPQPGAVSHVQQPIQQSVAPIATAPPAQTIHTGSTQARTLQLQDLEAGDEDLIEKEWVDKAEEIIASDEDNPRLEDQHQREINKIYLKKRFNLDVS